MNYSDMWGKLKSYLLRTYSFDRNCAKYAANEMAKVEAEAEAKAEERIYRAMVRIEQEQKIEEVKK